MAGRISMGARREITAAVVDRYRSAGRADKGLILDELCAVTGWHRKHAVRALAIHVAISPEARRQRRPTYGATIRDALVALWEASDRICGKRLRVMIPTLLPSLERHGRLKLDQADRVLVLGVSAATIDRLLVETNIAAAGGERRRVGFYSAVRREVPIRTFNDWHDPPPGFCEGDMVAHGGTSVAGSFIQTLTMVDVATGWTECMPLLTRESGLVVRAMERAQNLFPWLIRGADFDNDSAFMNDVVVPWCRAQKIEVTRSRAYKKNDQAFVEQKNGAVVRRLVGYGRFDGGETTRVLERLYAASRLHTNFFQPSFKLKYKRREGAKVIKRYHVPATPYERALAHPKLSKAVKRRLREIYRTLDPVALLAEMRDAQVELGTRVGARAGKLAAAASLPQFPLLGGSYSGLRPSASNCRPHSVGGSRSRSIPMPRGRRPSTAALMRLGARKASEMVILICRTLHFSRVQSCATVVTRPETTSSSHRRPRAIALTRRARRLNCSGRTLLRDALCGSRISRDLLEGGFCQGIVSGRSSGQSDASSALSDLGRTISLSL